MNREWTCPCGAQSPKEAVRCRSCGKPQRAYALYEEERLEAYFTVLEPTHDMSDGKNWSIMDAECRVVAQAPTERLALIVAGALDHYECWINEYRPND